MARSRRFAGRKTKTRRLAPMTPVELLEPRLMLAGLPPQAALFVGDVLAAGGSEHAFYVTYTDPDSPVDVSTFDSQDIRVTGPNGYNQLAAFESRSSNIDGSPRTAYYKITAPGGSWDVTDLGVYSVSLEANQVCDPGFVYAAAGLLGTFQVLVTDVTPPTAAATAATVDNSNTILDSSTPYQFTVTYHDNVAVKTSTIAAGNVLVTGAGYPPGGQAVTLVSVDASDVRNVVATFQVTPPGGTWAAGTNLYDIVMQADQVTDTSTLADPTYGTPGLRVPGGIIGSFLVNLSNAPTATVTASDVSPGDLGKTIYSFQVNYTAMAKTGVTNTISIASVNAGNVKVTDGGVTLNPFTYSMAAPAGNVLTVTYYVVPPGGSWDVADSGTYTVALGATPVQDSMGSPVTTVSTPNTFDCAFDVTNPRARLIAPSLTASLN
ncbi:MAG: hypothetical protein PHU85_16055, partial [Phycisphaerae bacterium]|nr:hypothetical protein [Phycisphaerae bacterium]